MLLVIMLIISHHLSPPFFIAADDDTNPLNGTSRDRDSLMSSMTSITSDPQEALHNWGSANTDVCNWTGVTCHRRKHRVVQLVLIGRDLTGVISPALANLSFLAVLDLSNNFLTGPIPAELGVLSRLKQLSLAANLLQGSIPPELGFLPKLVYLELNGNQFSGPIPETLFCNTTLLQYVDLSNNSLSGEIPLSNQCKLSDLMFLQLWSNNLEGPIKPSLSNSSKLQWLDLEDNYLSGELPSGIFDKLPHLIFLHLSYNNLSSHNYNTDLDPFFTSLKNCTYLQELELAGNNLGGVIPQSVGDISVSLLQLHLEDNLLYGPIPPNILNLVNLTYLNLSVNFLNGSIPPDISRLKKLQRVYFSNNFLSGEIPPSLGEIPQLGLVDLSRNMFSGSIPETLANLSQLRKLMLHNNHLSGTIPTSIGRCVNLEVLDLSHNRLTGTIPSEVAGLASLKIYLNLSSNFLAGSLPVELSKMDMILALDISANNLSGTIPPQLGSCIALEYLNLSENSLDDHLPSSIGAMPYLKVLDLSLNQLTGAMPESLQASSSLKWLNLSFNNLSGMVPSGGVFSSLSEDSFLGNSGLCGPIVGVASCRTKHVHHLAILPILVTLIGSSSCMLCAFAYPRVVRLRKKSRSPVLYRSTTFEDENGQSKGDYPRISHRQLVDVTGGFSYSNLIGSGRFGEVYKGVLPDGMRIAVKVLNPKSGFREISTSFRRECDVLKRTRHRNLIKIITTCSKPDFIAIVLPLMPNGNLDSHLYPPEPSESVLSLVQLVNIASDIAEGIAYLHHHSPVRVVHCDLKPSNVLLDEDMTAVVADFGIARLVKGGGDYDSSSNVSEGSCISTTGLLHGSVGYIAPEYGLGGQPSVKGDVYSFGVLLLEMITRKRPTDVIFHEGLTLQEWVKSHYPDTIDSIISETRPMDFPVEEDALYYTDIGRDVKVELIELGLVCTHFSPSMRPSMMDVANDIALLKDYLLRQCNKSSPT